MTSILFCQILKLVIAYLQSRRHLFDPVNNCYVNCEGDPLSTALGVARFHKSELR